MRPSNGVYRRTTVIDRGRPGWWYGQPGFEGYHGPRAGQWYAPGYGYYAAARVHHGTRWVVGGTLPASMRRYVVVSPAIYGLTPAAVGYGWFFAGTNIVLVRVSTGVIVQSVAGGW